MCVFIPEHIIVMTTLFPASSICQQSEHGGAHRTETRVVSRLRRLPVYDTESILGGKFR